MTAPINRDNCQICPVCQVAIAPNDMVYFSSGDPGTRARLYARVCQYAKKSECINKDTEAIGVVSQADGFSAKAGVSRRFKAS